MREIGFPSLISPFSKIWFKKNDYGILKQVTQKNCSQGSGVSAGLKQMEIVQPDEELYRFVL